MERFWTLKWDRFLFLKNVLSKLSIDSCLQDNFISARGLASITGQIISMSCAVGNITRLLTRNCYAAIEQRTPWDQRLFVSPEIRNELFFWQNNIDSINGKPMSPKSSAVGVVYSDASDTGFGGYFVQCGQDLARHLVRQGNANEFYFAGEIGCKICSFILA